MQKNHLKKPVNKVKYMNVATIITGIILSDF